MQTRCWMRRVLLGILSVGWGLSAGSASLAETGRGVVSGAKDAPSNTTAVSDSAVSQAATPSNPKTPTPQPPTEQAAPTPPESSPPAAIALPPSQSKSKDTVARTRLDGTSWLLELIGLSGSEKEKGKSQNDTLTFGAHTVTSERLSKAGFPTSNYSLKIGDDGVIVWETMQSHSDGKGVAFWRGEIHGDAMDGVLSRQPSGGSPEEFSFAGHQAGAVALPQASAVSEPAQAVSSSAIGGRTAPAQREVVKKKKR